MLTYLNHLKNKPWQDPQLNSPERRKKFHNMAKYKETGFSSIPTNCGIDELKPGQPSLLQSKILDQSHGRRKARTGASHITQSNPNGVWK